jgi:hypothetical protein
MTRPTQPVLLPLAIAAAWLLVVAALTVGLPWLWEHIR